MTELKTLLSEAIDFAERHGIDVADFICDLLTAKAAAAPAREPASETRRARPAGSGLTTHYVGDDVAASSLQNVKAWWYSRPAGYRGTAKQITIRSGEVWRPGSRALSSWLKSSPESAARWVGEERRSRVFERIAK